MLASTEGIVLHTVKYRESSVIATVYTRDFGRQSYLINAVRSKKSKNKAGLLQPLFLVDLVAYQKQSREVQRVKEIKLNHAYQNIPFEIEKSTQAIFIAEVLYKTINEQESYVEMYDFIKNTFCYFDLMETGSANFHLYFLFRLTEYLGFLPNTDNVNYEGWFDLKKGSIVPNEPSHPHFANKELTGFLYTLSTLKISDLNEFHISKNSRNNLLEKLLEYFHLHFESLGKIKSLAVLKEVFA